MKNFIFGEQFLFLILYPLLLLFLVLVVPNTSFAATTYDRDPSVSSFSSQIVIDVAGDSFDPDINDGNGFNFWTVYVKNLGETIVVVDCSNIVASTTLSQSFSPDLPVDDYIFVGVALYEETGDCVSSMQPEGGGVELEYNADEIIFSVVAGQVAGAFFSSLDLSEATEESEAFRAELIDQSLTLMIGTLAAFLGFALIFMAAYYVWIRFQNWTQMNGSFLDLGSEEVYVKKKNHGNFKSFDQDLSDADDFIRRGNSSLGRHEGRSRWGDNWE